MAVDGADSEAGGADGAGAAPAGAARPVLVTGGTGTLGRQVVRALTGRGGAVRLLSRRPRPADAPRDVEWCTGDLASGSGLDAALAGVRTVVNCASDVRRMGRDDEQAMRRLLDAAAAAGRGKDGAVPHVVHVSIVGIDRAPFPYYRRKLDAERVLADGPAPWTLLRATQFHDLVASVARALGRSPVVPAPAGVVLQPVDSGEVAERLAELAAGGPAGRVADFGGPEQRPLDGLLRAWLRSAGRRRPLLPVPFPGRLGSALRTGALLTGAAREGAPAGRITFEEFLRARGH